MTDANGELERRSAWLRHQAQELAFLCVVDLAAMQAALAPLQARLQRAGARTLRPPRAA